jgi:hypothetical protein
MMVPMTTHPTPNCRTPPYATAMSPCSQGGWQGNDDWQETDNGGADWGMTTNNGNGGRLEIGDRIT